MKSLQEEIQQRKWQNDQQLALVNVLFTYHWLKDRMSEALKPYKITMQQYNVLRILRGSHPKGMAAARIRERLLDKTSDVSRLLDRLEKLNFVERQNSPEDKRVTDLFDASGLGNFGPNPFCGQTPQRASPQSPI
jgi:hypothetical protein